MTAPPPYFSLVVPCYNEEARLSRTLPRMREYLAALDLPGGAEILVVDDGSHDGTARVAEEQLSGFPGGVTSYEGNRGKGHAVKHGMLAARGRIRLFSDADLSTPLEEIPRFLAAHAKGHDVVIGSRKRPGARVLKRQPLLRESMGKVFTLLTNVLVVSGVSDFTCGFKSFTAHACDTVFPEAQIEDWSYDAELLWLVRRAGLRLTEVPVRWTDDPDTRVRRFANAVSSASGLYRIVRRKHTRTRGA